MKKRAGMAAAAVLAVATLFLAVEFVRAQQPAPPAGDQPGGRRQGTREGGQRPEGERGRFDRGQFDPARMREMMMDRLREQMGATDEEWKALGPLVTDVMEKQGGARRGGLGFLGGRGPGRPGGEEGRRGPEPPAGDRGGDRRGMFGQPDPEAEALQKTLEDTKASKESIEAKLKAVRDARKKREAELQAAREKLRQVLTLRQEATLVLMGMLD